MKPFAILVTLFVFLTLTSSADEVERKGENEMVEKFAPWPEDLEPSSQIVFRPLFVYKQRQAELHEQRRRKAELEASEVEVTIPETVTQAVTWRLRPPAPNQPYYPYYPSQYYYNPYYGYNYGYYPYNSWSSRGSIRK